MKKRVVILDPFKGEAEAFNPLAPINAASLDECRGLADAMCRAVGEALLAGLCETEGDDAEGGGNGQSAPRQ